MLTFIETSSDEKLCCGNSVELCLVDIFVSERYGILLSFSFELWFFSFLWDGCCDLSDDSASERSSLVLFMIEGSVSMSGEMEELNASEVSHVVLMEVVFRAYGGGLTLSTDFPDFF